MDLYGRGGKAVRSFEDHHPLVKAVYFLAVLIPVMFVMNPVTTGIAWIIGILWIVQRRRSFPTAIAVTGIAITVAMTVINPLVSHTGVTELFFINGRAITLEAVRYGMTSGIMMAAAFVWFASMSDILTGSAIMELFLHMPKLGLLMSMILRLIPMYIKRYETVEKTVQLNEETCGKKSQAVKISSAVFSWALENSMDMADSMTMRGYSGKKRLRTWRFRRRDGIMLIVIAGVNLMYFAGHYGIMAAQLITCLLPLIYRAKERVKWIIYSLKN